MSPRFSNSPELHLRIADSRLIRTLQLALYLAGIAAVVLIAHEGRLELALLLALALFCSLPRLVGQAATGHVLRWRCGQWTLDGGRGAEPITLARGCRVTPWAVLFCWCSDAGKRGRVWILPDAVPQSEWRKLRVRLRLEC